MPEPKQHHLWRWASLAAAIALLTFCLVLLGSHMAVAQGQSSEPSAPHSGGAKRGNGLPASYPWDQFTASTHGELSPQVDDFDLVVGTWNWPGYARPGGGFVYGIYYHNGKQEYKKQTIMPADTCHMVCTQRSGQCRFCQRKPYTKKSGCKKDQFHIQFALTKFSFYLLA